MLGASLLLLALALDGQPWKGVLIP